MVKSERSYLARVLTLSNNMGQGKSRLDYSTAAFPDVALPEELWDYIAGVCPIATQKSLALTCKGFGRLVQPHLQVSREKILTFSNWLTEEIIRQFKEYAGHFMWIEAFFIEGQNKQYLRINEGQDGPRRMKGVHVFETTDASPIPLYELKNKSSYPRLTDPTAIAKLIARFLYNHSLDITRPHTKYISSFMSAID